MFVIFWLTFVFNLALCHSQYFYESDPTWHIRSPKQLEAKNFWFHDAQNTLYKKVTQPPNQNVAKNVIFFLGDGMSIPTVTASRIYEGQLRGIVGERNYLSFEDFSHVGLSKTYCVNKQVADSACSATAYLSGIKANYLTIGVSANVTVNDCAGANLAENRLNSIAKWAVDAGKAAGLVTTTRVTHASPAGTYAHTSNRDFESDFDVKTLKKDSNVCIDVARQLMENEVSQRFNVILGGGTVKFLPNTTNDFYGNKGQRLDGRNLINEWLSAKNDAGAGGAKAVYNREQLMQVDFEKTDYLLGLFNASHLPYNLDRTENTPTLEEMTETAIKLLSKKKNGYFLFVEGGRIDHGHHETKARKALDETVQFAKAIKKARKLTNMWDTLIVVTADHGHTMTINGYPDIDNDITSLNSELSDLDGLPYATLSYANGPVYERFYKSSRENVARVDLSSVNITDKNFQYPHGVPLTTESHGGGDVAVYANGPWAHLFTGVYEQNTIPFLMGFASCIGPGMTFCSPYPKSDFKYNN